MNVRWTGKASSDLARLYEYLRPVAPGASARVIRQLARAPDRLIRHPRIGERLEAFAPREVRRVFVGDYEIRYEIAGEQLMILRLWHGRELRSDDAI